MSHWAGDLVGLPWAPGATGPFMFDCKGLVRECARRRGLPAVPDVEDAPDSAWRAVPDQSAMPDDLITMQGPNGPHVGFMAHVNGRLGVLHANGYMTPRGPVGIVEFQDLCDAAANGYGRFKFWRVC